MEIESLERIEVLLHYAKITLRLPKRGIRRLHKTEQHTCLHCQRQSTYIVQRCHDRLCVSCRAREYKNLLKIQRYLHIQPSHFVHVVLPYPVIQLQDFRSAHIEDLKDALDKIRRQAWLKNVIRGGFYLIEVDFTFQLLEEALEARPHVHILVETIQSARSQPIDLRKGSDAWKALVGVTMQQPTALTKNTQGEVNKRFNYVIKQVRGDSEFDLLRDLTAYINSQSGELQGCIDVQREPRHIAYVNRLRENIQTAERLRAYITRKFNRVFTQKRRFSFFGGWWGQGLAQQAVQDSTQKPIQSWRCRCGADLVAQQQPLLVEKTNFKKVDSGRNDDVMEGAKR